ncbi:MAG: DsbA family protein [Pseudomonadota bacterium]
MTKLLNSLILVLMIGLPGMVTAQSFDMKNMTAEEREAFQAEIRAFLLENPEVIVEAIEVLEQRRDEATAAADRELVARHASALFDDGYSFETGNPDGDVTIVEFLDYRCGFCKRAHPVIEEILERDPNLKLIVKEFPILGPNSVNAGKMALAALDIDRDRYKELNDVLMTFQGDLTENIAYQLASEVGYDIAALKERADSIEVDDRISQNYQLAQALGVQGTPAFVVGQRIIRGFLPADEMMTVIEEARSAVN